MTKHNGWANYETWLVNIHFGDDEYITKELCQQFKTVGDYSRGLESYVKDYAEEVMTVDNVFINDIFNASLSEVNWYELAESYYSEWLSGQVWLEQLDLCYPDYFQGTHKINFAVPAHRGMLYRELVEGINDAMQGCDAGQWELELPCGITFDKVDLDVLIENYLGSKKDTLDEPIPECLHLEDSEEIEVYYYIALAIV